MYLQQCLYYLWQCLYLVLQHLPQEQKTKTQMMTKMNRLNAIRGWNTMGKILGAYIERVKRSIVKDKK